MRRINFYLVFINCFLLTLLSAVNADAQQWTSLGPDSFPALMRPFDYSLKIANGIGRVSGVYFAPKKKCFFIKEKEPGNVRRNSLWWIMGFFRFGQLLEFIRIR